MNVLSGGRVALPDVFSPSVLSISLPLHVPSFHYFEVVLDRSYTENITRLYMLITC